MDAGTYVIRGWARGIGRQHPGGVLSNDYADECQPELQNEDEPMLDEKDKTRYRRIVGSLLYITMKTQPDLCLAASLIRAYVESPSQVELVGARQCS